MAAKKKSTAKATPNPPKRDTSPVASYYSDILTGLDKKLRLASNTTRLRKMSTGLLTLDWVMSGGLVPGMINLSGMEASGKSTACFHAIAEAVSSNAKIKLYWDAEGAVNPEYTSNIFVNMGVDAVFGKEVKYQQESVIEVFYDYVAGLLRVMPDKLYDPDKETWFYRFPKRDSAAKDLMASFGVKPDKSLTDDNFYGCPTDNDQIEGIIVIDSYASLLTEKVDEDTTNNMPTVDAIAFSKEVKRVKTRLAKKGVILLGTNQIREKPGMAFGPSEYEPGGNALKFYSDNRTKISARAVNSKGCPGNWKKDPEVSGLSVEPSVLVEGAEDRYAYKAMANIKNKFGRPFLKAWGRVWTSDHDGQGRGFDPVFDAYMYLLCTQQLEGPPGEFIVYPRVSMGSAAKPLVDATFTWDTFKRYILGYHLKKKGGKAILQELFEELEVKRLPDLRKLCKEQVATDRNLWREPNDDEWLSA